MSDQTDRLHNNVTPSFLPPPASRLPPAGDMATASFGDRLGPGIVDTITDFRPGDRFQLDNEVFMLLTRFAFNKANLGAFFGKHISGSESGGGTSSCGSSRGRYWH